MILLGDCVEKMRDLELASIDAIVTDPPYSLEFMGKAWDRHDDEDAAFGYYLSGLIDGEGCFRVTAKHRRCEFTMKLRADDEWILRQTIRFVGHGRIQPNPARDGSAPQSCLTIDTKEGVAALCAILLRYPLRAKKLRDFLTWAEAVDEWLTMERGNRWHGPADRTRLAELAERIRSGRAYSEVAWSGNGFQDWTRQWATEAYRVLRPGGYLLAFGGTRTYHRLAAGVEDAGFEIRDQIAWLYGSGFPKSRDVARAIDDKLGATGDYGEPRTAAHAEWIERGSRMRGRDGHEGWQRPWMDDAEAVDRAAREYLPGSDEARAWKGWGTALKPALEPIVVARKPLAGTVAENLLTHGVGAINVDACRVEVADREAYERNHSGDRGHAGTRDGGEATDMRMGGGSADEFGRWPANVVVDETILDALAEARYFYCAKTSRAERNAGLDGFDPKPILWSSGEQNPGSFQADGTDRSARNPHPTVKPIALMRWLIRLVSPPGATILDPFTGSGSTGCAAALEGVSFVGIERDPDYLAIAEARIRFWAEHGEEALRRVAERESADRLRAELAEAGQLDLFAATTEGAA